jgi:alpha-N-arabinofuranosidase
MAELKIFADRPAATIDRNIYGHFSEHLGRCIYGGLWVGEDSPIPNTRGIRNDVVLALREMGIPVLRWPGGCFADEYHWMDGIGPRAARKRMVNTHWGGVTEDNGFGTHEFMDLCAQLGCEPYICGNVGSGTVREMQEWVEYMTFGGESPMADLRRKNGRDEPWRLKFFGVGNENWGCGGNMTPEYYAGEFRRYNTYVRNFGDNRVFRIACGTSGRDLNWTEVLMREAGRYMDGLSMHYYTLPNEDWNHKGSATDFGEREWFSAMAHTLEMDGLIEKHSAIMDKYDPDGRVALAVDEWGTWYDVEPGTNPGFLYQQNTIRDALVAGIDLNIFNNRCGRVRMANIAQLANVLQAPVLTEGEKMVLTPTYHVFRLYKPHQGARLLPTELACGQCGDGETYVPALNVSASADALGAVHVSVCNLDPARPVELRAAVAGMAASEIRGQVITADRMNAHNTFSAPRNVGISVFDDAKLVPGGFEAVLRPMSVTMLELK